MRLATSMWMTLCVLCVLCAAGSVRAASDASDASDASVAAPLRVQIVVALCDVATQGVVPPANPRLCDATLPRDNLYWGALYGVRAHLPQALGLKWHVDPTSAGASEALSATTHISGRPVELRARAYANIRQAMAVFFHAVGTDDGTDLVVFVGHDGLMDGPVDASWLAHRASRPPRVAVLACSSASYFGPHLQSLGADAVLMTTNLMAPEAYVVAALVRAVAEDNAPGQVREQTAAAYARMQRISLAAARRLFAANL